MASRVEDDDNDVSKLSAESISLLDAGRKNAVLNGEERRCILRLFFGLQRESAEESSSKGHRVFSHSRERTARLIGRSPATIARLLCAWNRALPTIRVNHQSVHKFLFVSHRRGNHNAKDCRIPNSEELVRQVRDFVRQKRIDRERVTAREVLLFLLDCNEITIVLGPDGEFETSAYNSAIRATQRFLSRNTFQREKKTGVVRVNPLHVARRNRYLQIILSNRSLPVHQRLTEVYTDESYLHHHHRMDVHSLYHPDDGDCVDAKPPTKGKRVCICAAIRGEGRTSSAGFVPHSVWCFSPQDPKDHKGDYHKVFHSENYMKWFREQLLPYLTEPSLIILDNASYHKAKPAETPKPSKMIKAAVIAELVRCGIEHSE